MIIKFPRNYAVDIDNVPDDFEDQIKAVFSEYTEGTAKSYTYQDKLCFIDIMANLINTQSSHPDSYEAVKELMLGMFEHNLDDYGELPDKDDFESIEFMETCYRKGIEDSKLYTKVTGDHHKYDKIMMLEYRAIKAVMEWEG